MQISRHWRLNAQRYRLEGYRDDKGQVSLKPRPEINHDNKTGNAMIHSEVKEVPYLILAS